MAIELFASDRLIRDGDMSDSFVSETINLTMKNGFSMHAIFTGAPVGTFYVSVSINNKDWTVLPDSQQAIIEAGDIFYNVSDRQHRYARIHYTRTSGSGTANVYYDLKEAA